MATYHYAEVAAKLIHDVARMNNQARALIIQMDTLYQQLIDLSDIDEATVRQAIRDRGFDDTEIAGMLAAWRVVRASMNGQPAIEEKALPRA